MTTPGSQGDQEWDRLIPFEGPSNFRDLGGYPTASGRRVRRGLVYRADSLHLLTPEDLAAFARLGINQVVDLRSDQERNANPNPIATAVQMSITAERAAEAGRPAWYEQAQDGEVILRDGYLSMIAQGAPSFGRFLRSLLTPDGVPVVFHCHAGKDRTGVLAAVLLMALGVDRETVADDYALTGRYRNPGDADESMQRMIERGMPPEAALGLVGAPRWAMVEALDALEHQHGGIEAYLTGPAGLSVDEVDAVREVLLEPG